MAHPAQELGGAQVHFHDAQYDHEGWRNKDGRALLHQQLAPGKPSLAFGRDLSEDANRTLDKDAAFKVNIIRKIPLHMLKLLTISQKNMSLRAKRFKIGQNVEKYLEMAMEL